MVFTLYHQIVKLSVAKCVSDKASFHTGNASSRTIFALEQDFSAALLKVERPVSDLFLKWCESSLNTSTGEEIATEPLIGKFDVITTGSRCDLDRTRAVLVGTVLKRRNFCKAVQCNDVRTPVHTLPTNC